MNQSLYIFFIEKIVKYVRPFARAKFKISCFDPFQIFESILDHFLLHR